jgi:single-strand DNA-binding protein
MNKVFIYGRITKDLELKGSKSGSSILGFSVATDYVYYDKNKQKVKETEFHNITFFGKQAEIISQYFNKGDAILVIGRLKTDKWEGRDGITKYTTRIIGETFEFGIGKSLNNSMDKKQDKLDAQKEEEIPTIDVDEESSSDTTGEYGDNGESDLKDIPF